MRISLLEFRSSRGDAGTSFLPTLPFLRCTGPFPRGNGLEVIHPSRDGVDPRVESGVAKSHPEATF